MAYVEIIGGMVMAKWRGVSAEKCLEPKNGDEYQKR